MSKRFTLSLVVLAVALLVSSVAFASPAPSVADEAFLSSLQAPVAAAAPETPALTSVDNGPASIAMACTYSCRSCTGGKLKFCSTCNGTTSCGACTTACHI